MAIRRPVGNLPAELSSFVGRRGERTELRRLLSTARLVTLTGFGGVGKTRLALRVAADLQRTFADGVWLVELAGLQDPSLVPDVVSRALRLSDQATQQTEALLRFLEDRQVLLVLDNCEHLLEACAELMADLLAGAPRLRVLATSRETLQLPGEHIYQVQPLPVPEPEAAGAEAVVRFAGLALFAERAAAVCPGFAVTAANAPLAASVCRLLDGVPLAIELAAARLRALSLEQLASQLDDRFRLLSGGNRGALPRHQTLRAAVQWSYELCAKTERLLWARSSVFVDRFTLAAAERVCAGPALPTGSVATALAGLIDKSVLVAEADEDEPRYRLLDTVRRFGLERLRQPDDDDRACEVDLVDEAVLHERHLALYIELTERFHDDWFGPRQVRWTRRMRAEFANLRAALGFCLAGTEHTGAGVRLAGGLYYFWYGCGAIGEGRYWLERTLAADAGPDRYRMRALAALARLFILQGLPLAAIEPAQECLTSARQSDDPFYEAHALHTLGLSLTYAGDVTAGRRLLEQAVARAGALGPTHPATAYTTFALATWEVLHGDPTRAGELYARSREISAAHGELWWRGIVLTAAIVPALTLGNLGQARAYAQESLYTRRTLHDTHGAASSVEFLAFVATAEHDHRRAARLLGAADAHWRTAGGSPFATGGWRDVHDRYETSTRRALGDTTFDTEFRQGAQLNLDDAAGYALGEALVPAAPTAEDGAPRLTAREAQIAELVAQGASNKQIAGHLVLSRRTVESHVQNILGKLGFTSRAQIAAWYTRQQPPN